MTSLVPRRALLLLASLALVVAACGGPVFANPPAARPPATPEPAATPRPADPLPVVLPRDDGPHDRLTEWWYYTGHLAADDGRRFGFEYVVFRAERGGFPVTWASHLALTDQTGGRFHYAQRSEIGPQVDRSPREGTGEDAEPTGFAFTVSGFDIANPTVLPGSPWTMAGSMGTDVLTAAASGKEVFGDPVAAFGIDLRLTQRKPPALHDRDGWIDFGVAGSSYYYSRTAMDATGSIALGDENVAVTGDAWFDHQWGDFISVGGGGWDWFAVNLDDGTDLTLSLVRAADGSYPLVYGTLVDAQGGTRHLGAGDFRVEVTAQWTSPATGAVYPAGWSVAIPGEDLELRLSPTVPQQELDTRATTGVVYWEGSQGVTGTRGGSPILGKGYVELTGYPPTR
ncbi:MAG TPA: lipocalin family protein [Candidatus Limnocylindrales bacterium]|nr:lipocalin family protein [Candidatus Limnocylindrales bacterium]